MRGGPLDPEVRAVEVEARLAFGGEQAIHQKTGTATTYYTRGLGGQLINRRSRNTSPSYYHHDAIGSVVGLTDSTGALTDAYAYTAFGEMRSRTGTSAQPYQYLGNFYDPDSKLYDFHAGTYDPAVGRFTTKDPIGGMVSKSQTLDPYSCSMNNPLTYPDPYGLFAASTAGGDFSDVPDGT